MGLSVTTILIAILIVMKGGYAQNINHVQVAADVEYQVIDNFGASDAWSFQKIGEWVPAQKEKVADLLFSQEKGIGLSSWRFNIGAGINNIRISHPWRTVETFEVSQGQYNWTRQEEERWFLHAAKERGVDQFIAFVNSPPARMTINGYTNCSDSNGSTNLRDGYENQYATYLVDILKHFRDEWNIDFKYISPVNEPQWEWNGGIQEGNRASNSDIKRIVTALSDELQTQSVNTNISVVESGDLGSWYSVKDNISNEYGETYGNYLNDLINDPMLNTNIAKHLGGHSYWSDRINSQLVQHREALYLNMLPFLNNGWKYWMTEYTVLDGPNGEGGHGRDLGINTALDVLRVLHYDLTILKASAWQWWTAVSPENFKDGLLYTDYKDNPYSQTIIESKLLWGFGNFSRFVRPNSIRVKLAGANDKFGLLGTSFLNREKDKMILVLINMANSSENIAIDISGLEENKKVLQFTPYITNANPVNNLKKLDSFEAAKMYTIPAQSIVTLVGSIIDTTKLPGFSGSIPNDHKLYQNYPNPFNGITQFYYYLPESGKINISIFSSLGEKIITLVDHEKDSGFHNINWDGTNINNQTVSSGIYFYSMVSKSIVDSKKMIYIQ